MPKIVPHETILEYCDTQYFCKVYNISNYHSTHTNLYITDTWCTISCNIALPTQSLMLYNNNRKRHCLMATRVTPVHVLIKI